MSAGRDEAKRQKNEPLSLSKQLQPIADAILLPLHDSFLGLTTSQGNLF